jgi:hypothetical protein
VYKRGTIVNIGIELSFLGTQHGLTSAGVASPHPKNDDETGIGAGLKMTTRMFWARRGLGQPQYCDLSRLKGEKASCGKVGGTSVERHSASVGGGYPWLWIGL